MILIQLEKLLILLKKKKALEEAKLQMNNFLNAYDKLIPLLNTDATSLNNDISTLDEKVDEYKQEVHDKLILIAESLRNEMNEADKNYDSKSNSIITETVIVSILALIIAIVFIIVLVRLIARPLIKGVDFAKEISEGNLTANLNVYQKDEVGQLATALKNMTKKLSEIVSEIISGSDNLASASQQISSSSQQMSQGANEQASAVEEVSSTMEQMAANIQQNTESANEADKIFV